MVSRTRLAKTEGCHRRQSGVTLLETIIAVAALGMLAVVVLSGLSAVLQARSAASERAVAVGLASNQMEKTKASPYISYATPDHGTYATVLAPAGYTVEVTAVPVDPATGQSLGSGQDNGVQKITVTVSRQGGQPVVLHSYKVGR
ncbi:MAG: type II secretion system protein [Chloroflexi bacterium]|nr:type II secretion system protein [Chloroflexota bacterium]